MENLTRRQIRYLCFRLATQADGGSKASQEKDGPMHYVEEIKDHMESQDDFGGWSKFAKTWDVDEKAPLVVVLRTSSIQTEWGKTLRAEANDVPKKKKLLKNKLSQIIQKKKNQVIGNLKTDDLDL